MTRFIKLFCLILAGCAGSATTPIQTPSTPINQSRNANLTKEQVEAHNRACGYFWGQAPPLSQQEPEGPGEIEAEYRRCLMPLPKEEPLVINNPPPLEPTGVPDGVTVTTYHSTLTVSIENNLLAQANSKGKVSYLGNLKLKLIGKERISVGEIGISYITLSAYEAMNTKRNITTSEIDMTSFHKLFFDQEDEAYQREMRAAIDAELKLPECGDPPAKSIVVIGPGGKKELCRSEVDPLIERFFCKMPVKAHLFVDEYVDMNLFIKGVLEAPKPELLKKDCQHRRLFVTVGDIGKPPLVYNYHYSWKYKPTKISASQPTSKP